MSNSKYIRVAIAGLGNCASSLIEGIQYYRQGPDLESGLLFPTLCDYSVRDIEVVTAFDVSSLKVGRLVKEAIYQSPNNFVRIPDVQVDGASREPRTLGALRKRVYATARRCGLSIRRSPSRSFSEHASNGEPGSN